MDEAPLTVGGHVIKGVLERAAQRNSHAPVGVFRWGGRPLKGVGTFMVLERMKARPRSGMQQWHWHSGSSLPCVWSFRDASRAFVSGNFTGQACSPACLHCAFPQVP